VQYETRFGSRKANNIALDGKELWLIISDFASQPIVLNQKYATPNERANGRAGALGAEVARENFFGGSGTGGGDSAFRVRVYCHKADKTPSPGLSLSP
jgi:hypothetical protein